MEVFGIFLGVTTTRHGLQILMTKIRGALGSNFSIFNPSRTPETVSGNVNKHNFWDWETRPLVCFWCFARQKQGISQHFPEDTATSGGFWAVLHFSRQHAWSALHRTISMAQSRPAVQVAPESLQLVLERGLSLSFPRLRWRSSAPLKRCIFDISHVIHVKCMYDIECA